MQQAITQGRPITSEAALNKENKVLTNAAIGAIRDIRVAMTAEERDHVESAILPAVNQISLQAKRQVLKELEDGELSVQSIDRMRKRLTALNRSKAG